MRRLRAARHHDRASPRIADRCRSLDALMVDQSPARPDTSSTPAVILVAFEHIPRFLSLNANAAASAASTPARFKASLNSGQAMRTLAGARVREIVNAVPE